MNKQLLLGLSLLVAGILAIISTLCWWFLRPQPEYHCFPPPPFREEVGR